MGTRPQVGHLGPDALDAARVHRLGPGARVVTRLCLIWLASLLAFWLAMTAAYIEWMADELRTLDKDGKA